MKRGIDPTSEVHVPSLGRKKRSGEAALALRGDGWSDLADQWGYHGVGPRAGPDVQLHRSVDALGPGSLWDDLTRSTWE